MKFVKPPTTDTVTTMNAEIAWNCDFCGKSGIIIALDGTLYCKWCRMTYGESTKETVLEVFEKLKKEAWFLEPLPKNSIIEDLPLEEKE